MRVKTPAAASAQRGLGAPLNRHQHYTLQYHHILLSRKLLFQELELLFYYLLQLRLLGFDIIHAIKHRKSSSVRIVAFKKTRGILYFGSAPKYKAYTVLLE